jgi:hypothetical protein
LVGAHPRGLPSHRGMAGAENPRTSRAGDELEQDRELQSVMLSITPTRRRKGSNHIGWSPSQPDTPGAGGTGIEPATRGFGERGTLAQLVSCRLILPIFLRSLYIVVSSSLAASRGFAVKYAVNCTRYRRDVVGPFKVC